jgi:SAM-dependent methyltransferase
MIPDAAETRGAARVQPARSSGEQHVYGACWNTVHQGYFADSSVAAPLVRKVHELALKSRPERIVDLGGGTGYVLSRLLAAGLEPGVSLVNLDNSSIQLEAAKSDGLTCFLGSVESFARPELGPAAGRFLFLMRSVLHYFGQDGPRPVLRHLRAQARPGEYFVHQTASFSRREDANCLNGLYRMMRTRKWYPTVAFLRSCLRVEGWDVLEILPAAPLRLNDDDLAHRYRLDQTDISCIRDELSRDCRVPEDVFQTTESGFRAFLHYWIYVCTPASSGGGGHTTASAVTARSSNEQMDGRPG